jgi:hypothetical protein
MKPELSRLIAEKCNIFMSEYKLAYSPKDSIEINKRNAIHRKFIDYISKNDIKSIGDIPIEFNEIVKAKKAAK